MRKFVGVEEFMAIEPTSFFQDHRSSSSMEQTRRFFCQKMSALSLSSVFLNDVVLACCKTTNDLNVYVQLARDYLRNQIHSELVLTVSHRNSTRTGRKCLSRARLSRGPDCKRTVPLTLESSSTSQLKQFRNEMT